VKIKHDGVFPEGSIVKKIFNGDKDKRNKEQAEKSVLESAKTDQSRKSSSPVPKERNERSHPLPMNEKAELAKEITNFIQTIAGQAEEVNRGLPREFN